MKLGSVSNFNVLTKNINVSKTMSNPVKTLSESKQIIVPNSISNAFRSYINFTGNAP